MIVNSFSSFFGCREHPFFTVLGECGQHFSSVQCSYSRQQRSPSQPAMRSVCEVSACSVLTDINVPRGCAPIQPSTARLARSPDQVRMCFARMVGSSTGSRLDHSSGCCVVDSVARLMTGHRIARASAKNGTTPTLPHMRHNVGNRRMT